MKKVISVLLVAIMLLSVGSSAFAETREYDFAIYPSNNTSQHGTDAKAKKKDSDTYYYVTQTSSTFSNGTKIWYVPFLDGTEVKEGFANPLSIICSDEAGGQRKKAKYGSGNAIANRYYWLAGRTAAQSASVGRVVGRWTPYYSSINNG